MTFIRSCWVYVEAPLRCPAPQFWQFRLSLFPLKEWYKAKSRSFVHYETSSQCTEGTLSSENVLLVAWLPLVVSLLYFGPKSLVYSKPKKKKKERDFMMLCDIKNGVGYTQWSFQVTMMPFNLYLLSPMPMFMLICHPIYHPGRFRKDLLPRLWLPRVVRRNNNLSIFGPLQHSLPVPTFMLSAKVRQWAPVVLHPSERDHSAICLAE